MDGFKFYKKIYSILRIYSKILNFSLVQDKFQDIDILIDIHAISTDSLVFYKDNAEYTFLNKNDDEIQELSNNDETYLVLKHGRDIIKENDLLISILDDILKLEKILKDSYPILDVFYDDGHYNFDVDVVFYNSCNFDNPPVSDIKYINIDNFNRNSSDDEIQQFTVLFFIVVVFCKNFTQVTSLQTRRYFYDFNSLINPRYDNLECFSYSKIMSYFNNLVSNDAIILPYNVVKDRYKDKEFFIRPDSSTKSFPGQVVKKNELGIFDKTYHIFDEELCIVASIKNIISEKRCFINVETQELISSSLYFHDGKITPDFDATNAVKDLFKYQNIYLYNLIVADFALMEDGTVKLIEFNSPHTSGFYDCNIDKICRSLLDMNH